jgi:peptidoglycan/LPS O-acetylase OafA/YrhL
MTAAVVAILALGHFLFLFPEMLIGVVIGVPVIIILRNWRSSRIDAELGNISYGCFLCQETIFFGLQHFGLTVGTPAYIGMAAILCWGAGYAPYQLVERPTIAFRRSFKARAPVQTSMDAAVAPEGPPTAQTGSEAAIAGAAQRPS